MKNRSQYTLNIESEAKVQGIENKIDDTVQHFLSHTQRVQETVYFAHQLSVSDC